jgi:hypothetical protein
MHGLIGNGLLSFIHAVIKEVHLRWAAVIGEICKKKGEVVRNGVLIAAEPVAND